MQPILSFLGQTLTGIDLLILVGLSFLTGWRTRRVNRTLLFSVIIGLLSVILSGLITGIVRTGADNPMLLLNLVLSIELGRIMLFCVTSAVAIAVAQFIKNNFGGRRLFSKK